MAIESVSVPLGTALPWFDVLPVTSESEGSPMGDDQPASGEHLDTAAIPEGKPVLVVFLSNHSPYVRSIETSLGLLTSKYEASITIIGICSNDERAYPADDRVSLRAQAERAGFTFRYCQDPQQRAAKAFGASCTPEFFVYNHHLRLAYHGQYDSSRPDNKLPVTGRDLSTALDHVLASEVLLEDQHRSFGCSIKWSAGSEPLYLYRA